MSMRRNPDGSLTVGIIDEDIILPEIKKEPKAVTKVEPKAEPPKAAPKPAPKGRPRASTTKKK